MSSLKFKVGDSVKVIKKVTKQGSFWVSPAMDNMVGRTFSVLEVHMSGQYRLDSAYGYWFLEESLELVKSDFVVKFLVGDKVIHKNFPKKVFTVWGLKANEVLLKEPGIWVDAKDLSQVFEKGDPEMEKSQTAAAAAVPPAIKHKTFIFGTDSDSVSDEDIFDHIFGLEQEVNHLELIQHKPKALKAKIESLKKDIQDLVEFSDSRQK